LKVFFIFPQSEVENRNIVSLISAFADIESIGQANDMVEALEAVQNRYPAATVSNAEKLRQKPELLSTLYDGSEGAVVVVQEKYIVKDKNIYIGVDFSSVDPMSFDWTVRSIRRAIEECHGKTAD
jgi:hypothetical protein